MLFLYIFVFCIPSIKTFFDSSEVKLKTHDYGLSFYPKACEFKSNRLYRKIFPVINIILKK